MADPLVSICMSAYNTEEYIVEALDSALAQTWDSLEIIIVDDGSTDETGAIVDRYTEEYDAVTAVHQKNQRHSAGMNRTCAGSLGTPMKLSDAGDLISAGIVEGQVDRFKGTRDHAFSGEWRARRPV